MSNPFDFADQESPVKEKVRKTPKPVLADEGPFDFLQTFSLWKWIRANAIPFAVFAFIVFVAVPFLIRMFSRPF